MQTRTETRRVGQFTAAGDDGKDYTVIEFRDFIHVTYFDNKRDTTEGLRSFKLPSGHHVNCTDQDNYEIVSTGIKLRRK